MPDLITNARARLNLPGAKATDEAVISILVRAASAAIERYCRRRFPAADCDELYHGSADCRLLLRHYPILAVAAVRRGLAGVLAVANTSAANQQARVALTATGVELVRVAGGVQATSTVSFAGNATLAALASAITALGNGWSAQVVGDYGSWPAADLRAPQGAVSALGRPAELGLHTETLADFQIDAEHGWLARPGGWRGGLNEYRVQYTAGYAAVPEDVQEACAELVATWFAQRGRDLSLTAEHTVGTYSYRTAVGDRLPDRVRGLLRPYRQVAV